MAVRIAIVALFLGTIVAAQDWLLPEWRAEQRAHMEKLAAIRPSVKAGETTHLPDLLAILAADTYPSIRHEVLELLGRLRDPRVFVALHEAFARDQIPSTRRRVVAAFGACGDARGLPVLLGLLEDERPPKRSARWGTGARSASWSGTGWTRPRTPTCSVVGHRRSCGSTHRAPCPWYSSAWGKRSRQNGV